MRIVNTKPGVSGILSGEQSLEFVKSHYYITKCLMSLIEELNKYQESSMLDEEEQEDIIAILETSGYERMDISTPYANIIKGTGLANGIVQKHLSNGMMAAYVVKQTIDTVLSVYEITAEEIRTIIKLSSTALSYLAFGFNREFDMFDNETIYSAVYNASTELKIKNLKEVFAEVEMKYPPILSLLEQFPDIYERLIGLVDQYVYNGLCEALEAEEMTVKELCDILDGKLSFELWKSTH